MNPGLLNKRLAFASIGKTFWGQKIVKTKRRDDEQNEEMYDFIVRKNRNLKEYMTFVCEDTSYIVLTMEEYQKEKGYLLLRCEKSRIHSFYDRCTVSRLIDATKDNGADGQVLSNIFTDIPCELVRTTSGGASQSQQQNDIMQRFELYLENSYALMIGDELEITHKLDVYKVKVKNYFRTHTHQTIEIELETEA
jgi:hypothetical protein